MMPSPSPDRIDAHHHLWRYNPDEYGWIDEKMLRIRRDFVPEDLRPEMERSGIHGAVVVQARQKLAETDWLLSLAREYEFIWGVVGWVPLADAKIDEILARYSGETKLRGVRHVLQDEPDDFFMLRDDFNRGVARLGAHGLAYDILVFERHLPQTITFVDRHPDQIFVLDHIGKPRIRTGAISPWRERLRELARRPNVYCKLSGMVTEASWRDWSADQLKPYVDTVLEAFGPDRLMFGSDWPVCLVACDYERWVRTVEAFVAPLSPHEQARIFGGTAIEAYQLSGGRQ